METESQFVSWRRVLLFGVHVGQGGVEIQRELLGARPDAHTRARALARAVLIAHWSFSSIASSSRHAVGCDATGPNRAGWSRIGARSEQYPPPWAAITARSTSTRPES